MGPGSPSAGRLTRLVLIWAAPFRLTNSSDCGGTDCVNHVGYSYWRTMNNHVGGDTMLVFLSLQGTGGPTLFSDNKVTDQVVKVAPLFDGNSVYGWHSGEGWYFSATQRTKLYVSASGPKLERYDVITKTLQTVFDITSQFGANKYIWRSTRATTTTYIPRL